MSDEKRRYERFSNTTVSVQVSRPGIRGFIRSNPEGDCLNFSRTGMQFDCRQPLESGEKLVLDIEVDEILLQDLNAEVVTRQKTDTGAYCHGVRFCLEDVSKDKVFHCLLQIEDRLKSRHQFG